ncbi:MAG: hypothetical protein U1D67_07865 [Dehalococcoidia bacterium]|nr:hypothetical protein [Dehalococcoidia bacterium]
MDESTVKRLMRSLNCVLCGKEYKGAEIKIMGHNGDTWFIKVLCHHCNSESLVAAVVKEGLDPEVITDLDQSEFARFQDKEPVQGDDVLDMHGFLKRFKGDFSSLFSRLDEQTPKRKPRKRIPRET